MSKQGDGGDTLYDYLYSKFLMKDMFGISMADEDFLESSYPIFREIGNIAISTHILGCVVPTDLEIELPCNLEAVESVATGMIDSYDNALIVHYNSLQAVPKLPRIYTFLPDVIGEERFDRYDLCGARLRCLGTYIPYKLSSDKTKMIFESAFIGETVKIIYKGILIDDECNPLITMKMAVAIAYKMAFIRTQKEAFMRDPQAAQLLSYIKPEAERKMAAAKIPEFISENFLDKLLSAKTTHNRKVFYSSYKTLADNG